MILMAPCWTLILDSRNGIVFIWGGLGILMFVAVGAVCICGILFVAGGAIASVIGCVLGGALFTERAGQRLATFTAEQTAPGVVARKHSYIALVDQEDDDKGTRTTP
jgi:hypothetical protein